ncbi:hypothetical protein [Beijerinckia sp. L45]|uniref:hypothetical protein n=1 Tax=Beijerinckia sp. L45 TaxID=1641855 RepID=UPI00131ECFA5|nr:hypothetical protein [Beijerinckia sp. L45]
MTRRLPLLSALAAIALLFAAAPCSAGPILTCADFKTRLDETIVAMGSAVASPGALKPGYDSGEAGKRFDWDGIVGLTGTMNCSKADAFEDFSIAIPESVRTSDDLPIVLRRFMELASASICTLADATPEACRALTKSMTDGSLAQFRDGVTKGEAMPTGTRDFFIVAGVDAELDMTPVGISWSIGPGQAMTTGAVRQKLTPENADK